MVGCSVAAVPRALARRYGISVGHLAAVDAPEHAQASSEGHGSLAGLPNIIVVFSPLPANTIEAGERRDLGKAPGAFQRLLVGPSEEVHDVLQHGRVLGVMMGC